MCSRFPGLRPNGSTAYMRATAHVSPKVPHGGKKKSPAATQTRNLSQQLGNYMPISMLVFEEPAIPNEA